WGSPASSPATERCAPWASSVRFATPPSTTRSRRASGAASTAGPTATSMWARSSRPRPTCRSSRAFSAPIRRPCARCCTRGGPAESAAELYRHGSPSPPEGGSAAPLTPPAFGLAGVNLHTWTGWGSVTHWNAFVATLEMHGKGTFFDPRLDDTSRFPIAAANGFGHVTIAENEDRITPRLPALHFFQLALRAPRPPDGT